MKMTVSEAFRRIDEYNYKHLGKVCPSEGLDMIAENLQKYQRIKEIVKTWREVGLDYDSCDAMENIERVIANEDDN